MSALAGLLLTFVLPALAGGALLAGAPRGTANGDAVPTSVDILIARGLACGLGAWMMGSGLLTRTVDLTATTAWVWDGVVGAASVGVLLLPRNRLLLRSALAPAGRRLAAAAGLTALVFLPVAFAMIRVSWSPLGSTPWYYYGLAQQVADAGVIPPHSIEFATTTPFLNDYHLFTTSTAMLLAQDPNHPMTVITIVALLSALLLGVGMMTLTSALGGGRLVALLAVPLAVATGIAAIRLVAYRPEGFALGLTVLVAALSVDWLRRRAWRSLATAALLAATLSQVHGLAALTAGAMVAAAAIVAFIQGRPLEQLKRTGIMLVSLVGAVVVTGFVFDEASGTVHAGGLVDRGGLADPTWEFFRAARGEPSSMPQSNGDMVVDAIRDLYHWSWWWFLPVLLLVIFGLWRHRDDPVARRAVGFSLLSLVGIAAIASVFMFGWQGYVPRRTGASRLVLEASLVVPPLVAIGLSFLAREVSHWRPRRILRPTEPSRLRAMLGALTVFGVVSLIGVSHYVSSQAPSRDEVAVWQSLPLTSSDIVLANGYTEGFIPAVTDANGLLDGRAPYTFGDLLDRGIELFRGGQAFFTDPAAHWDYLADNDVTWIVVADDESTALGTGNIWGVPPNLQALEGCAGLEWIASTSTLTAFRVVDSSASGCSG